MPASLTSSPLPLHPSIVLAPFLEDVLQGARVAIFGDATLPLAEELLQRGARLVHAYDPEPERIRLAQARNSHRSLFFAPLPGNGDVGVRDGAFDVVVVPDLSFSAEPQLLLGWARRLLSPQGAAIVASPNTECGHALLKSPKGGHALGYYELYDQVSLHFRTVRMMGQIPFVAYALADFAVEDAEAAIDTSLSAGASKEPEWFLAIASERELQVEPYALIQLPRAVEMPALSQDAHHDAGLGETWITAREEEHERAVVALSERERRISEQKSRIDALEHQLVERDQHLVVARARAEQLSRELVDERRAHAPPATAPEETLPIAERERLQRLLEEEREGRAQLQALLNEELAARTHVQASLVEDRGTHARLQAVLEEERGAHARLQAVLEKERGAHVRLQAVLDEERTARAHLQAVLDEERGRASESREALERQRARAADLERQMHAGATRTDELRATWSSDRAELVRQHAQNLTTSDQERDKWNHARSGFEQKLAAVEEQLASHRAERTTREQDASQLSDEVQSLEAKLAERGIEVTRLGSELQRRERLVRDMIVELEDAREGAATGVAEGSPSDVNAQAHAQLEKLAARCAEQEANLVSSRWRIQELERRLTRATLVSAAPGPVDRPGLPPMATP